MTCEYTIQRADFIKKTETKLEDYRGFTWRGHERWPFDDLLRNVIEISNVAGSRKGTDPKWTVVLATLVSIYRSEDAKLRAAETYKPETPTNQKGPILKDTPDNGNPYRKSSTRSALGPKLVDDDDGEDYG